MKVVVKYDLGHLIEYNYDKINYFCPCCGEKTLYQESGAGDYYLGSTIVCTNCKIEMYSAGLPEDADKYKIQVIDQIKDFNDQPS